MSLPDSWVNKIFTRLSVRYGRSFLAQYGDDIQADAIKADWAVALGGFVRHPASIEWALENLPERAPNASQFRLLCKEAPGGEREVFKALAPPPEVVDKEGKRKLLQAVRAGLASRPTPSDVLANLRRMAEEGRPLTLAQRAQLKALETEKYNQPVVSGEFRAIPAENCPWNKRGEA